VIDDIVVSFVTLLIIISGELVAATLFTIITICSFVLTWHTFKSVRREMRINESRRAKLDANWSSDD
jgi:hypothetical protein